MSYTIGKIQEEMNADGSHWWDRGAMRSFGTRVGQQVYQGDGGIYFVTSEKPLHGPRRFSVRKYNPTEKDIDTVGKFCEMSRDQAHRKAADLAGSESTVTQAAHVPTSEVEQLTIDIQRGGGRCGATQAAYLIRLTTKHHRLMEDYCNDGEEPPTLANLRGKIRAAASDCTCSVRFSGDPRGATVKLLLPNGNTNDWGKEGWCIPTK